jgi:hypothetical protein
MSNVYASTHPLVQHKLSRLRDKKTEPKKFRELVREIAALLAYEATTDLAVTPREFETPLARMTGAELQEKIGLVPILRAGLGMVEGLWSLMPSAESGTGCMRRAHAQTGGDTKAADRAAFALFHPGPDARHGFRQPPRPRSSRWGVKRSSRAALAPEDCHADGAPDTISTSPRSTTTQ